MSTYYEDIRLGEWQSALAQNGMAVARIPVTADSAPRVIEALARQGFDPELRESASLGGLTVRLNGAQAVKLMDTQAQMAKAIRLDAFQPATTGAGLITRLPVKPGEEGNMMKALKDLGFKPEYRAEGSLGPNIRLSGTDAARMIAMQQAQKPAPALGQSSFMKQPSAPVAMQRAQPAAPPPRPALR